MIFGLFLILVVIMAAANAQTIKKSRIILGKSHTIESKILNEKRRIWVYVPHGAKDPENLERRYPVIYLLDGNAHFSWLNKTAQQLCGVNSAGTCRDMIMVAIPNTDRVRDFTPTNYLFGPDGNQINEFKVSGGGEKFIDFIEKELIPYIDSAYPTDPYKVIFGHSLGGLAVMNIVINRPHLFNAYAAIEPSMWWDGKKLLKQAHEVFKMEKFRGRSLFLAIANTMPGGMDIQQVRKDSSGTTAHIRSILELADILEDNPDSGLNYTCKYYNDCDHGSITQKAGYDALCFLFSYEKDSHWSMDVS
jgi:uncharacterized protein